MRRLQDREPDWADRLDIVFVGRSTLAGFRSGGPFVEISHLEPLQSKPDAAEWLETWFLAREADTTLIGPSLRTLIPPIARAEFLAAIADNVERHAQLVIEDPRAGAVAYRILTLCRTLRTLDSGVLCTKVEGATWVRERFPAWHWLVDAALETRAGSGSRDFTPEERAAVAGFLASLAGQIGGTRPAVPS